MMAVQAGQTGEIEDADTRIRRHLQSQRQSGGGLRYHSVNAGLNNLRTLPDDYLRTYPVSFSASPAETLCA